MYYKAKRFVSFFVIIGLFGAVSAFANPVKTKVPAKTENFVISLDGNKEPIAETKIVNSGANHLYRLTVKQGETVSFKLTSTNRTSLKVQSPSGTVKQAVDGRNHKGILIGEGEFVFEIGTEDFSPYRLEIKRK